MVTVLLWILSVMVPCALVLRVAGVEAGPQRATAPSGARRRQRRARPARSRRRPVPPPPTPPVAVRRPPPRLPHPTAEPLPTHKVRSSASLVVIVGVTGLMVAVAVGGAAAALALALRAAVD